MTTATTTTTADAVRNLIVCDTQFGWAGETTLQLPEILDLQERGWLIEGDENNEFSLTDAGHAVVASALAQGSAAPVMWWDGGERAITAREKALIEEHRPSCFSIPLVPASGQASANPTAWLVAWRDVIAATGEAIERRSLLLHNAVGDFRAIDPDAKVTPLYDGPPAQGIDLSPIAKRKVEELSAQGYVTNGVAIFNPATGQRGLVDNLGYVGWQGVTRG